MNGLDEEQMGPQTFLYGCELKAGYDVVFHPEDHDDFEHQLDIRMVCMGSTTKDELHVVEIEGRDMEGQTVKAVLASLQPSILPSVCTGGFAIIPPAVFRLKAGSGPIHISGQHLVMMGGDQFLDEEDEDEEEEEEEVQTSKKRPASAPALKSLKRIKMDEDEEEEEEEEDDDDDDDDLVFEEEESPVKPKKTPSKPEPRAQNGKSPKTTPAAKPAKTPGSKGEGKKPQKPKATPAREKPQTPKKPLTVPELKTKMMACVEKGTALPKLQPKFENFLKNGMNVSDPKIIQELWSWRQTLSEGK